MLSWLLACSLVLLTPGDRRTLLIFGPSAQDPRVKQQRAWTDGAAAALGDRDLDVVWVPAQTDSPAEKNWRRKLKVGAAEFRAVLVGKDGSVKLSRAEPVPPEEICALVDTMPMRQRELRQRSNR